MTDLVKQKLSELPAQAGVYFHKDKMGEIIYVGKAAILKNRVRQYFHKSRARDPKTEALVSEIVDIDWMTVDSELEALFLEAEMIRRYMPRYNILLRDDKALSYIRIDYDSSYPTVTTTRRPLDDGARYFGPYYSTTGVREALRLLRRAFPYATKRSVGQKRATLHYHLGLDPGLEEGRTTLGEYRSNLRKLIAVIEGKKQGVVRDIEKEMNLLAKKQNFEKAAKLRNQMFALRSLEKQIIFSDKEFLDISKDHALSDLSAVLGITKALRRIEGYDISHMSGTDTVASMVVFTNGVSDKQEYRKFKMRIPGNDDFAHMREVIERRTSQKNCKQWGLPSLFLIDGGKGQLGSAIEILSQKNITVPAIGLAKQYEEIIIKKDWPYVRIDVASIKKLKGVITESDGFWVVNLPDNSHAVKLLQRIRDESHRFAVSYHSTLKTKRQTISDLDNIDGVGPLTKKRLLKHFGSLRAVKDASLSELEMCIPNKTAGKIYKYFCHSQDKPV